MNELLIIVLLVAFIGACSDKCNVNHPEMAPLVAECKLRVMRECPNLKHDECPVFQPCPQCPAIEECDKLTKDKCYE